MNTFFYIVHFHKLSYFISLKQNLPNVFFKTTPIFHLYSKAFLNYYFFNYFIVILESTLVHLEKGM